MQTTEPTGRPHRNHGLFSDHYLNATLPGRPDWRALAGEAEATMAEVSRVLEAYAPSQNEAQTEEVRKRRPKGEARLTPSSLRDLRSGYEEGAAPVREARAEAAKLEGRLSNLVNEVYGLTDEEVALLWSTAPPRMPTFRG